MGKKKLGKFPLDESESDCVRENSDISLADYEEEQVGFADPQRAEASNL